MVIALRPEVYGEQLYKYIYIFIRGGGGGLKVKCAQSADAVNYKRVLCPLSNRFDYPRAVIKRINIYIFIRGNKIDYQALPDS